MPLDPLLVSAAIKGGLSAVCATCRKYWEGREKGLPEPRCTATTKCGSPLAGDDFHEYSGPMVDFDRWCFVCAENSHYGVSVRGRPRIVGVCKAHVRLLSELLPVDLSASDVVLRSVDGRLLRPEDLAVPQKKTLFQAIEEAERSFEEKS